MHNALGRRGDRARIIRCLARDIYTLCIAMQQSEYLGLRVDHFWARGNATLQLVQGCGCAPHQFPMLREGGRARGLG